MGCWSVGGQPSATASWKWSLSGLFSPRVQCKSHGSRCSVADWTAAVQGCLVDLGVAIIRLTANLYHESCYVVQPCEHFEQKCSSRLIEVPLGWVGSSSFSASRPLAGLPANSPSIQQVSHKSVARNVGTASKTSQSTLISKNPDLPTTSCRFGRSLVGQSNDGSLYRSL